MSGGKSLAIYHFLELQAVVRHEEAREYQGPLRLGREAFQA
jgi:hypothetical protein